ncbi:MAG TPA: hypothetical protein VGG61_02330 [Gemmataceae bacterium]
MSEFADWMWQNLNILLGLLLWIVWWLWAVNWTKVWPVLAQGAWLGVVLFVLLIAMVWSHIDPNPWNVPTSGSVPSDWACLGCVCALTALALFCGWLQGVMGWSPAEIELEPAKEHGHATDHGHGH